MEVWKVRPPLYQLPDSLQSCVIGSFVARLIMRAMYDSRDISSLMIRHKKFNP